MSIREGDFEYEKRKLHPREDKSDHERGEHFYVKWAGRVIGEYGRKLHETYRRKDYGIDGDKTYKLWDFRPDAKEHKRDERIWSIVMRHIITEAQRMGAEYLVMNPQKGWGGEKGRLRKFLERFKFEGQRFREVTDGHFRLDVGAILVEDAFVFEYLSGKRARIGIVKVVLKLGRRGMPTGIYEYAFKPKFTNTHYKIRGKPVYEILKFEPKKWDNIDPGIASVSMEHIIKDAGEWGAVYVIAYSRSESFIEFMRGFSFEGKRFQMKDKGHFRFRVK